MADDVPPEIVRRRAGNFRILGWLLLVIILAVFLGLYFFGVIPHQVVHPPVRA